MSEIKMQAVKSSNVESIGHHHGDILRVRYMNGGEYDFIGVTLPMFNKLSEAESIGRAIKDLNIKGNRVIEG